MSVNSPSATRKSVTRRRRSAQRPPVAVHALAATLAALRLHVFNGVIWPDFTQLPDKAHPVLALSLIHISEPTRPY